MKRIYEDRSGTNNVEEGARFPSMALTGYGMSSLSSLSSSSLIKGNRFGSVLIIHGNQRIAKFLDGVLRNGFRIRTSTGSREALKYLREDPPDAVLCDIDCLGHDSGDLADVLENVVGFLEIPLILLRREHSDDSAHTRRLLSKAVDCISPSLAPSLLKWKVMQVISLKREVVRLRMSVLEARKRSEQFESLTHLAAHDLKPSILAMSDLLRGLKKRLEGTSVKAAPDTMEILDKLSSSCQSVEAFLSDMNEVLSTDEVSTRRNPIRLDEIAREVIEQHWELLEDNEIDVQLHAEKNLPRVIGNRNGIKQVFENLLTNALCYMGSVPNPAVSMTITEKGKQLVTTVSDNGVGIPDEYRSMIFDPFIRVPGAVEGNGIALGLSLAKHIVNGHNGKLWLETESEEGSRFVFTLPKYSPVE